MTSLKAVMRELTPPLAWRWLHAARTRLGVREFQYVPEGWQLAGSGRVKGWNVAGILAAYQAGWPEFLRGLEGSAPLERAPNALPGSPADPAFHNLIHCYGYVLARAAWQRPAISLLDWGGGLGHYLLISRTLMPGLEIDYHCKDLSLLAEAGQALLPEAHFYSDESCLSRRYDLVLASHSLYYSENWAETLSKLARATDGRLYIAGLPTVLRAPSFVFVQRPYRYGYGTEYLGWCVNRSELMAAAQAAGLRLEREFALAYRPEIHGAPEQCEYRGYLFVPGE